MHKTTLENKADMELTKDSFLGGKLLIYQPKKGFRAGTDSIFLSAFINAKKSQKIAELGCGVGTVSLALALRVKQLQISAFEINEDVSQIAKQNVLLNKLEDSISIFNQDIKELNSQKELACSFNIVLSNPPFYKQESTRKSLNDLRNQGFIEQSAKLEDFIKTAKFMLKNNGQIYFIHLVERLDDIVFLLKQHGFGCLEILFIYSYANKDANRVIVKARKNSKGFTKVFKPFVVHNENGFSKQASAVLNNCKALVLNEEN